MSEGEKLAKSMNFGLKVVGFCIIATLCFFAAGIVLNIANHIFGWV